MSNLKLNFLPFETQDFTFKIYRREMEGLIEKDSDAKWYRLFPNSESTERRNYYVSISSQDDFESFDCHPKHNIELTKWFLFESLSKILLGSNFSIPYLL